MAAKTFGTHSSSSVSRMARLLAVPTTLNTAKAPSPSGPTISSMLAAVSAALYWSSASSYSIVTVLPPKSTPPSALTLSKYAFQPRAISANAAVSPDCG